MMLQLDRSAGDGLQTQLLDQLQNLIASGRIAPLSRMPATRNLARQLGISRTTVMLVYEELIAEGYLQTKPAAGTFVSALPPGAPRGRPAEVARFARGREASLSLPRTPDPIAGERLVFDFRSGGFDHRLFPAKVWQRLVSRALRDGISDLADDHPTGSERLRAAVAGWMMAERGIPTHPEEVIIVSGIRQACYILSRLLLDGGFSALVDGFLPRSVAWLFGDIGTTTHLLPAGYRPSLLERGRHKLAWLNTPHPHASREVDGRWRKQRSSLLDWAQVTDGFLAEYEGFDHILFLAPPANDGPGDRTVRLGEFSPTLGLGTRMGYMIVPPSLVERVTSFKESLGGAPPSLEQAALARFIEDGGYSRHLRRVGKVMTERRASLIAALQSHFIDLTINEPTAEDLLNCRLPEDLASVEVIHDRARAAGLALDIPEPEAIQGGEPGQQTLWLSYARMSQSHINTAVGKLAAVVNGPRTGRTECLAPRHDGFVRGPSEAQPGEPLRAVALEARRGT